MPARSPRVYGPFNKDVLVVASVHVGYDPDISVGGPGNKVAYTVAVEKRHF
jgi:hypothetical protein|tara:strand:- start:1445 stop:1597 length:153 start_codon:yes stop_codon:yes gene_type:complete